MTDALDARERAPIDPSRCVLDDFASDDATMRACLALAIRAARIDLPILLRGETGTGKTLLARAIHNTSRRSDRTFASFNAAALSDTLLDSQLFGHERGAFTGADRAMRGKFEQADGGTLLIDEIGDMSLSAQGKVLRAVEAGEYSRLGSDRIHNADVRIVAATHLPLAEYVAEGRFRRDLFYRVSGIAIVLPPLRERPRDLRTLIAGEIQRAALAQGRRIDGIDRQALALLLAHPWPGNLRELKAVVQAAVALSEGAVIGREAVRVDAMSDARSANVVSRPAPEASPEPGDDLSLRSAERRHIESVLRAMKGNKRRSARALGISRTTLDRKLESWRDD